MPLYLFSSPAAAKLATGPHASLHRRRQFLFRVPHRPSRRAPLLTSAAERPAGRTMATADTGASTVTDSRLRATGVKQALISLSDKTDLANLGNGLQRLGFSIISTGGTASSLEASGVNVTKVEEITQFPEMLDGRVKTLHPSIHGGILARRDQEHHLKALKEHGIGLCNFTYVVLQEMSYNNYLDADAAWNCVSEFESPTCVVVKHTNPCGVASRHDILEAYRLAVRADPVSAFGGIVAFNTTVDEDLAREIREFRRPTDGETRMFYEIVVAPGYTAEGLEVLKGKSKTLRILEAKRRRSRKGTLLSLRQVGGGWLAQEPDDVTPEDVAFTNVSERAPDARELSDAKFACLCVKHVKSNAIVIAKVGQHVLPLDDLSVLQFGLSILSLCVLMECTAGLVSLQNSCMLGMGSGQPNRLESLRIAFRKAGEEAKGAALASDAFFPFAWNDAVEEACQRGVAVIAEPGGSIRDQDAVECCNKYGVALVFTGVRHFRH
ncbi:Bifunctional purine biosynthesis protein PurH [Zea mays]|uniref:Bifunctional purine biosynthesis protein PurH n=1 Tax=Zea mays TaxID=4577 RepID=A0A3L6GFZ7_MAIZE|nr:Bifunctional purine biosynthesis protein PurH [Zea mays]